MSEGCAEEQDRRTGKCRHRNFCALTSAVIPRGRVNDIFDMETTEVTLLSLQPLASNTKPCSRRQECGGIPIGTRVFLYQAAVCLTASARYSRTCCARGCPTCSLARIARMDGTVPDAI